MWSEMAESEANVSPHLTPSSSSHHRRHRWHASPPIHLCQPSLPYDRPPLAAYQVFWLKTHRLPKDRRSSADATRKPPSFHVTQLGASQVSVQTGKGPCRTLIRPFFRMFICFIFVLDPALHSINSSFTLAQSPLNVAACHPPSSAMRSPLCTWIQFNNFFFISDTALPRHPHCVGLSPACSHSSPSLPLTPLPPVLGSCVELLYKSLLA